MATERPLRVVTENAEPTPEPEAPDVRRAVEVDRSWSARAACTGADVGAFFDEERWPEARRVCAGCPARAACLETALAEGEEFGLFGGLTPRERELVASGQRARREDLLEVVCSTCEDPVTWPLEPVPVDGTALDGTALGDGHHAVHRDGPSVLVLVAPTTTRDVRAAFRVRCRNGHPVGRPTAPGGTTVIGFDLDRTELRGRRRRLAVAA